MPHAVQIPGLIQRGIALPLRGGFVPRNVPSNVPSNVPVSAPESLPAARGRGAAVLRVLWTGVLFFLAGSLSVVGLAAAYSLKRALDIDVVPGVDMLPDEEIEAAIRAVLALLGF